MTEQSRIIEKLAYSFFILYNFVGTDSEAALGLVHMCHSGSTSVVSIEGSLYCNCYITKSI